MNTQEKLADDLGQITFRLETNFDTLNRTTNENTKKAVTAAINRDIEKLKEIKQRILCPNPN